MTLESAEARELATTRQQLFHEHVARVEAEQALQERDEFLALASHELKTPAATLSATAQLLRRQLERQGSLELDQLQRALDRLQDQSGRLARLVDHLLDVSRINSARLTIQLEPTDLVRLVSDVVTSSQLTTSRHTIELRGLAKLDMPVDRDRMTQVVTNLLDNAIKYSPEGGRIEVEVNDEAGGQVCILVRDYGIGIPEDRRDKLFERSYRAHPDGPFSGMGLGLFISRHVVELHGGSISADSPPDGGARFTVRLPAATGGSAHPLHLSTSV